MGWGGAGVGGLSSSRVWRLGAQHGAHLTTTTASLQVCLQLHSGGGVGFLLCERAFEEGCLLMERARESEAAEGMCFCVFWQGVCWGRMGQQGAGDVRHLTLPKCFLEECVVCDPAASSVSIALELASKGLGEAGSCDTHTDIDTDSGLDTHMRVQLSPPCVMSFPCGTCTSAQATPPAHCGWWVPTTPNSQKGGTRGTGGTCDGVMVGKGLDLVAAAGGVSLSWDSSTRTCAHAHTQSSHLGCCTLSCLLHSFLSRVS